MTPGMNATRAALADVIGAGIVEAIAALRDVFEHARLGHMFMSATTFRRARAEAFVLDGYPRRVAKRKASAMLRRMRAVWRHDRGLAGQWGER